VDSPVIAGEYFRVVRSLLPDKIRPMNEHCGRQRCWLVRAQVLEHYKTLLRRPTLCLARVIIVIYHFLYSLSGYVAHFGLEHHESTTVMASAI